MEAVRDMDAAFEEWFREIQDKAKRGATQEARQDTIRELCQNLDIELTPERLAQLKAWDADQLGQVLRQICVSQEWPDSADGEG